MMVTYKELIESGLKPEEARKYLLEQKPQPAIQRKTPPLEKYAPPPEKAVTREPVSIGMSIMDLSKVLGRLEDGMDYIRELVAEFDGKRVRVVRGIRRMAGIPKHGYYVKFESATPPRVLHEIRGASDPGEVKHWHEILRGTHPQLEVTSRWDAEADKWVFEGGPVLPKDIWRWDPYEAAKEVAALKPTKMDLVTFKRWIPGRELPVAAEELELRGFRLTPPPEYLTGEE